MITQLNFIGSIGLLLLAAAAVGAAACGNPQTPASSSSATGGPGTGGSPSTSSSNSSSGSGAGGGASIGNCPIFPADNPWNTPIDGLAVRPDSDTIIANMNPQAGLHRDFGPKWEGRLNGIPVDYVTASQALVDVTYGGDEVAENYPDESDCGPMPIPPDATVERASDWSLQDGQDDMHVIVVDTDACTLYELYLARPNGDGSWRCGTSAVWDLNSNDYRPMGYTSADAAGLPIFPGLVRTEEVMAAVAADADLGHALRFTMDRTRKAFMLPATHFASDDTSADLPPMGMRFRLKSSFDITPFSPKNQVILRTLKRYGMILADNGGDWFVSGVPQQDCQGDACWSENEFSQLKDNVKGSDFEIVDSGSIYVDWDGVSAAEQEIPAKTPLTCTAPRQTDLACVCFD